MGSRLHIEGQLCSSLTHLFQSLPKTENLQCLQIKTSQCLARFGQHTACPSSSCFHISSFSHRRLHRNVNLLDPTCYSLKICQQSLDCLDLGLQASCRSSQWSCHLLGSRLLKLGPVLPASLLKPVTRSVAAGNLNLHREMHIWFAEPRPKSQKAVSASAPDHTHLSRSWQSTNYQFFVRWLKWMSKGAPGLLLQTILCLSVTRTTTERHMDQKSTVSPINFASHSVLHSR